MTDTSAKTREALVKSMVDRFLAWPLPADFAPDNGISATRPNYGEGVEWRPIGTNLLTAAQAEALVQHLLGYQLASDTTPDAAEARAKVHALASFLGEQTEREAVIAWLRKIGDSRPHGTDWRTYYAAADAIELGQHIPGDAA